MAHYYQGPPSTMFMQQPLPMPSQLSEPGKEVHKWYKDIMSLHYGRNPFVQKNDINKGNVYSFKFRGKEVCITLYHNRQNILYMHVDGDGRTEWCDAAIPILEKQCEKHERERYRKSQIPVADIPETADESKKTLVPEEEFHKYFANPFDYDTEAEHCPDSTILLYKYSSNATTKYWDIPEDTWKKIVNKYPQDAELIMIEDLKNIQDYLTIQPEDYEGSYKAILSIEVIISRSPCYNSSQALCWIKEEMDEKVKQCNEKGDQSKTRNKGTNTEFEEVEKNQFKITFSNFNQHLEFYNNKHMEGLKDLLKSDIKLDVFTHDNWDYFFNAAGLITERPWRRRRERDDKKILQYLEELVTYERMPAALKAMEEELRKNRLL